MNDLNTCIINIRVELQKSKLNKSGKNKYAGFKYFELADFLPKLNELMLKYGVNDIFTIEKANEEMYAVLKLIKGEEKQEYKIPFELYETPTNTKYKDGKAITVKSMQDIQYLGALNTYYKRYLYINAFGITDGEIIDSMENEEEQVDEEILKEMTKEDAENLELTFGKNKGKKLKDVPKNYLEWLAGNTKDPKMAKALELLGFINPTEDEQVNRLEQINILNELILKNNNGSTDLYESIEKHYGVEKITDLTNEQLHDAIMKLGAKNDNR